MAIEPKQINVVVDLTRPGTVNTQKELRYGDKNLLTVEVTEGGSPIDLTTIGAVTTDLVVKRLGSTNKDVVGSIVDGKAQFTVDGDSLAVPGYTEAVVQFYDAAGDRISTATFSFKTLADPSLTAVGDVVEQTIIQQVLVDGPQVIADAEDKLALMDEAVTSTRVEYKGVLANDAALAALTGMQVGDWYRITSSASNGGLSRSVRYDGTQWVTTDLEDPNVISTVTAQLAEKVEKEDTSFKYPNGYVSTSLFATIQEAVNYAIANSKVLFIPPGVHTYSTTLTFNADNFSIIGAGNASVLQFNGTGRAISVNPTATNTKRRNNLTLSDFTLKGNAGAGHAIYITSTNDININALSIYDFNSVGLYIYDGYEQPKITNCVIKRCKQAGVLIQYAHDAIITSCSIEENGVGIDARGSVNMVVDGNAFDDQLGFGIMFMGCPRSTITGNLIEDGLSNGIYLQNYATGSENNDDIVITGNNISNNTGKGIMIDDFISGLVITGNAFGAGDTTSYPIQISQGALNVAISGNTVSAVGSRPNAVPWGMNLKAGSNVLRGISIVGNTFGKTIAEAIDVTDATFINISANTIIDPLQARSNGYGIVLNNVKDSVISNNIMSDGKTTPTMSTGIYAHNGSDYNIITNNRIKGVSGVPVYSSGANSLVKDNL